MPYRRLPNTDKARLRAIHTALKKESIVPVNELAFSFPTLERLQFLRPKYEAALQQLQASRKNQFNKSKEYGQSFRRAKLYISHFIQVLTFAIIREEIKPEVRPLYGLSPDDHRIPPLNLEKEVLHWGEKIIEGEHMRNIQGGSPIYSPSIALVKVHYESFVDAYHHQKMLQSITTRASQAMLGLRDEADLLIPQVWNEIEEHYTGLPDRIKRQKAAEYGVCYVYRSSELKKIEAEKLQHHLSFDQGRL